MRHERPIGASSQKWKCPDGPFVCLTGTRDQGRLTSDWQLSLIVISSKARNLFHRDQGLTLPPHVPRTSPLSSSVFHTACALSAPSGHLPLEGKAAIREYHLLKKGGEAATRTLNPEPLTLNPEPNESIVKRGCEEMNPHFFTAPFVCYKKSLSGAFSVHFLR